MNAPPTRALPRTIALDGPAAAGKTTVGRHLADALGYLLFDTGVLYRAVTVVALREGVSPDDGAGLAALAERHQIDVTAEPERALGYRVTVDGRDVTARLRQPDVSAAVSPVSVHAELRDALLAAQRRIATLGPVVMVGRDIGTVVLPDADLKLYLSASPEARARRRFRERLSRGQPAVFADVLAAVRARDARDAGRSAAPLAVAPEAVLVDTDACGIEAVVRHLRALVARWPDALTTEGGDAPCGPNDGGVPV